MRFVRTAERAQEAPFITLVAEPVSDHRKQAYGQKALADIAAEVAAVVEGNGQNNAAYTAGLKVGSLVAGGCLGHSEAYTWLVEACQKGWGKPIDRAYGPGGAIRNGIRNGMKNPRGPSDFDSYIASIDFALLAKRDHDPETGEVIEDEPRRPSRRLPTSRGTSMSIGPSPTACLGK